VRQAALACWAATLDARRLTAIGASPGG
jgi:hypothetical protein